VLCGGVHVDKSSFIAYQRLLVIWQTMKVYTMERWSDDLVRSGLIPIIGEFQLDNEDQWCVSRNLTKVGSATNYRSEIEPYLSGGSPTITASIDRITVRQGQIQIWSARGFPPNSIVRVSISSSQGVLFLGPDPTTNENGEIQGSFEIGTNLPTGPVTLKIELASGGTLYGQTRFTIEPSETMSLRYSSARFRIQSDVTYDISWFFQHIENVYEQLKMKLGHEPTQHLPIMCTIKRGSSGGIRGWTSEGEMGIECDSFVKNCWCLVMSAQELTNLFTGSICSGWPTDWWANHKSPFPVMVAVEVIRDFGYVNEANDYDSEFQADQLYVWHKNVKKTCGWEVYQNMFSAMKKDGIQLDRLGPNPGRKRTNYALAYMKIGAGMTQLPTAMGVIPDADQHMIEAISLAREKIQTIPHSDLAWAKYLNGEYL